MLQSRRYCRDGHELRLFISARIVAPHGAQGQANSALSAASEDDEDDYAMGPVVSPAMRCPRLPKKHGRGLKIIDAVVGQPAADPNEREGTIVRFEKTLEWLPGAAGQHLFRPDGGSQAQPGQAAGENQ